jgi:hypothetical protein
LRSSKNSDSFSFIHLHHCDALSVFTGSLSTQESQSVYFKFSLYILKYKKRGFWMLFPVFIHVILLVLDGCQCHSVGILYGNT